MARAAPEASEVWGPRGRSGRGGSSGPRARAQVARSQRRSWLCAPRRSSECSRARRPACSRVKGADAGRAGVDRASGSGSGQVVAAGGRPGAAGGVVAAAEEQQGQGRPGPVEESLQPVPGGASLWPALRGRRGHKQEHWARPPVHCALPRCTTRCRWYTGRCRWWLRASAPPRTLGARAAQHRGGRDLLAAPGLLGQDGCADVSAGATRLAAHEPSAYRRGPWSPGPQPRSLRGPRTPVLGRPPRGGPGQRARLALPRRHPFPPPSVPAPVRKGTVSAADFCTSYFNLQGFVRRRERHP